MHNCDRLRLFHTGIKFARTSEIHSINEFGTMLGKTKGSVKCNLKIGFFRKILVPSSLPFCELSLNVKFIFSFIYFLLFPR
jgi:hypothetical protein